VEALGDGLCALRYIFLFAALGDDRLNGGIFKPVMQVRLISSGDIVANDQDRIDHCTDD
jgi:hypothetical protein